MLSKPCTASAVGAPLKLAAGANLTKLLALKAKPLVPTVPIANQVVPALVEYCQTPCAPGAVLPVITMPERLEAESTSVNKPVNKLLTAAPAGFGASSKTAASIALPRIGASFTGVMSKFAEPATDRFGLPLSTML